MNIKFTKFNSSLHDAAPLNKDSQNFIDNLNKELGCKLKYTPNLKDYDADLKLIFIETGGSENLFLKNFKYLKEPYVFLTSGHNNSLAASIEILTYLNSVGKKGEILHGDTKYIVNRIKELAIINKIKKGLKDTNFGVIGKPSDWLIASIPNYDEVYKRFGIKLIDIPIKEIIDYKSNTKSLIFNDKYDIKGLKKANDIYFSLKNIIKKYKLNSLTTRCFDLLKPLGTTACLALSKLNDENIIATCEGDIASMISMKIASLIGDGYTFQANPSRININNRTMVLAHCTIPTKMLSSYKLTTHFESNIGVAIKGELKEEDITIFRLNKNLKDYFVTNAKILHNLNEKQLCRTQIEVKCEDDISSLLKSPCGNHHIIFYGHYKNIVEAVMKNL